MAAKARSPYEYFSVAADIMVLRCPNKGRLEVLLIQRKNPPYQGHWALPGGFLDLHEDALMAAKRELEEETGLKCNDLVEFGSFSDPNRDPRGRVITISFYTVLKKSGGQAVAGDDASHVEWFPVRRLPVLAFDHKEMIAKGLLRFRSQSCRLGGRKLNRAAPKKGS